ncbi:MAG TPA: hypothetical protein HA327_01140 [Candidatus Poseidoniaceae archaeon]|nr:MAG TPA: hypothetical protein D7H81_01125 [Candidatus Poseidoniales archaeon]HII44621.1 hypothetical protein [Candidatus Poseidoniaceae archaeon]|tara:strand:- start:507 stop:1874 length:1368 start_codon:yes stop_codon:yes gene_type:complete
MADVELSNEVSSDAILREYENQNVSMVKLVKTLLSTATMPHVVMIVIASTVFYLLAGLNSLTVFSSMAFTSLAVAYAITALLSNNRVVKQMITLDEISSETDQYLLKSTVKKFKICLFPLAVAAGVFFIINTLTGENGILPGSSDLIPTALGMLFILWSIIQGSSFSQWASSNSAHNFQKVGKTGGLKLSILTTILATIVFGLFLSTLFYQLNDFDRTVADSLLASIPFIITVLIVTGASLAYSRKLKILASMKPSLQHFSGKFSMICHLFITWHLLTIWRQNFLDPSSFQVFLEEIVLMIFTVLFAIWSMTSKSYKSNFRLITEDNALTWGLSFGYAYAGSVAMLTSFFDDIKTVMLIGHCLVVLTVLIMHKIILSKIIGTDNYSITVRRITSSQNEENSASQPNILPENPQHVSLSIDNDSDVWQEDDDVDWETEESGPEIDGVEWEETIDID